MNKKILIVFAVLLTFGTYAICQNKEDDITYEELLFFLEDETIQLVDVRTTKEYKEGYIGNAIHCNVMNSDAFLQQIETLDKEKTTVLYCKSGVRSTWAYKKMKKAGFTNVKDFKGGYKEWLKHKK